MGMSATREDRTGPQSQNHWVSMGLPGGKTSGKDGGEGRKPVRGVGGSGEDGAVTVSGHICPIPAMCLWKSRSWKIFPRCVLCSQKESLPAKRIRQISFMERKCPVVIKQAISARTSEHTRK